MSRKVKFNLNVQSDALLCPNPSEWYAKSYIQENVADNFRPVPGVKDSTKVSVNKMTNILKSAGCNWNPVDTVLDAETVSVCKLDAMVQICQYDVEESFVALKMAQGDANWQEADFLAHFWETLSAQITEEIQLIRWNGNTEGSTSTMLDECDGYLVQLDASSAVEYSLPSASSITDIDSESIITILEGVIASLPEAVLGDTANVRIYMSAANAFQYMLATLGRNADFNYAGTLPLSFAGYKISVQPGMDDNFIVAGNKNQLAYAFDGIDDDKDIRIVNMMDTTAEPVIRARVGLKLGFKLLADGNELAYFDVNNI